MNRTDLAYEETTRYPITSGHAKVVVANTDCWSCSRDIEVICIYCQKGLINGEEFKEFAISNITAIDETLAQYLRLWPNFRFMPDEDPDDQCFANYCSHCSTRQDDYLLHCEPGGAFFKIKEISASLRFIPLESTIQLDGIEITEES